MKRLRRLSIVITDSDKMALKKLSLSEGEKMSVLIRQLIKQELKRRGLLSSEDYSRSANNLSSETSGIDKLQE